MPRVLAQIIPPQLQQALPPAIQFDREEVAKFMGHSGGVHME